MHNIRITTEGFYLDNIRIGEKSIVGACSVVNTGIVIGNNSVVRIKSWVGINVPDFHELSGNPPQLKTISESPLGNKVPVFGSDIFLTLLSLFIQFFRRLLVSIVFIFNGYNIFLQILYASMVYVVAILVTDIFWAFILSQMCNNLTISCVGFDSWEYVFVQRARLLIGRQVQN